MLEISLISLSDLSVSKGGPSGSFSTQWKTYKDSCARRLIKPCDDLRDKKPVKITRPGDDLFDKKIDTNKSKLEDPGLEALVRAHADSLVFIKNASTAAVSNVVVARIMENEQGQPLFYNPFAGTVEIFDGENQTTPVAAESLEDGVSFRVLHFNARASGVTIAMYNKLSTQFPMRPKTAGGEAEAPRTTHSITMTLDL